MLLLEMTFLHWCWWLQYLASRFFAAVVRRTNTWVGASVKSYTLSISGPKIYLCRICDWQSSPSCPISISKQPHREYPIRSEAKGRRHQIHAHKNESGRDEAKDLKMPVFVGSAATSYTVGKVGQVRRANDVGAPCKKSVCGPSRETSALD